MRFFRNWPVKPAGNKGRGNIRKVIAVKQFISFVKKEFYHIFRDKRTMLILLALPVVQLLLFGFAITTEIKNADFAVLDMSRDEVTHRIIRKFDASEYFNLALYSGSFNEIENALKTGKADLAVIFSGRFDETLLRSKEAGIQIIADASNPDKAGIQIIADASDPNRAAALVNYAESIIAGYMMENYTGDNIPYQIIPELKLLYNPQMKSSFNFVPGVLGMILMLICAMMTSISIVREKETGTMEVLLASPVRPVLIVIAKTVPYFVLSCINLATVLLLSVFVLKVPVEGSISTLMAISLLFIFVSLSLGLLVSTIVRTQIAAMLVSGMTLMMPVVMLSGMMFPVENMPVFLQWISHIIPARWYISAVRKLMIKGLGISSVIKEMTILSAMALLLVTASLRKFKIRLE